MSLDIKTVKYDNEGNLWVCYGQGFRMYDAVEIAWVMLKVAKDKGIQLSNLQLQKLVYIAHGYFLAWKDKPLIADDVEAWKYGPVISSIYQTFKTYGSSKIPTESIEDLKLEDLEDEDKDALECIEGILEMYGKDRPESLIAITHQADSPWYDTWERKNGKNKLFAKMDNDYIRKHYLRVMNDPESVGGL
ncbi:Panacea domain-containing protein [Catenovulum maritimum]|uniref:Panacea domain-containing protein n=1 Tax=Catenovulum maritimum TaxID=1513271 RepID=UPI00069FE27E|nr:type II toxin-antitoxin system antitoxin SocA domain-containing protein [Catenovulum maritimum]